MSSAAVLAPLSVTDRTAWLLERRTGIGGSDAAAVVGMSPYKTPLQLYMDKTVGEMTEISSPAIHWGNVLEPVIRQEYSEQTGREIYMPKGIVRHPEYPFMLATLDGFTDDDRLVEIKTTRYGDGWGKKPTEIPQHYMLQVQHSMAVTGLQIADVPVLIAGQDFRIYEIEADPSLQELLIVAETRFWERVQNLEPPEPMSEADFKLFYRVSNSMEIEATAYIADQYAELVQVKTYLSEFTKQQKAIELEIKKYMGENEILTIDDRQVITWKTGEKTRTFLVK